MRQWEEKRDHLYYLTEFASLKKKKNGETTSEFNKRFNKIYNKIPWDINTLQAYEKFTYAGAYEDDLVMITRERIYATLSNMQDDSLHVEGNMKTSGKMKHKQYFDKNKPKSEADSSSENK